MLLHLLIGAALVGPPVPAQPNQTKDASNQVVTVNLADRMADHMWWIGMGTALDLGATGFCLAHNPTCHEANPLGVNPDARIALKLAQGISTTSTVWKLEKDGHHKMALIVRWVSFGVQAIFAGNNVYQGFKK